jgi:peptidoglycan/LPS O-acetylase OafA/YrhL
MRPQPLLRPKMPELDTIRGIAILAVLFYHGFFWQTDVPSFVGVERLFISLMWVGRLGVSLFFVLSGFLITGLLLDTRSRSDYYSRFYIRRALRILPAYYAILLVLAATRHSTSPFLLLSMVYLSNLTPLFGIAISYPVLWSLAVEEHFYLLWPAIVRHLTLRRLALLSSVVVVVTPMTRLASFYVGYKDGFISYVCNDYTWNASDGLACGALLAILIRVVDPSRVEALKFSAAAIGGAVLLWLVGMPFGILTRQRAFGAALQVTPWNIAFAGLLGIFLVVGTGSWRFLVVPRPLCFFGEISYGLYLIHILIFDTYDGLMGRYFPTLKHGTGFGALWLRFFCAASVATLLAYASRRWFENPFLRLKDRLVCAADSSSKSNDLDHGLCRT